MSTDRIVRTMTPQEEALWVRRAKAGRLVDRDGRCEAIEDTCPNRGPFRDGAGRSLCDIHRPLTS